VPTEGSTADLVRWVRRFQAVESQIDAERRAHPPTPDESLARASSLRDFAEGLGAVVRPGPPSEEDLDVYRTWDRLRHSLLGRHA
jgi:hypothetical protein